MTTNQQAPAQQNRDEFSVTGPFTHPSGTSLIMLQFGTPNAANDWIAMMQRMQQEQVARQQEIAEQIKAANAKEQEARDDAANDG